MIINSSHAKTHTCSCTYAPPPPPHTHTHTETCTYMHSPHTYTFSLCVTILLSLSLTVSSLSLSLYHHNKRICSFVLCLSVSLCLCLCLSVVSLSLSLSLSFTSYLYALFMLVSDINTWGSLLTMMLNPLLILYLKTQVLMLTGKLQCLLFTLWSTEKKCWFRNPVLVCNCQAMGYRYYASYPAPCTNVMYFMLVIQHSVRRWRIVCSWLCNVKW